MKKKNNNDTQIITLTGENGQSLDFMLAATIEHDNNTYAIMKPLDKSLGIAEDEALVFIVTSTKDGDMFELEMDEVTIEEIFDIYNSDID